MKKKDFIDRVAEKAELSKAAAARAVDAIFHATSGAIAEAVQAGQDVAIPGFGKFRTKKRGARKGRNPRTGTEIDIPERTVVQFSPGKGLSDTLGGKSGGAKRAGAKSAGAKSGGAKSAGAKSGARAAGSSKSSSKSGGSTRSSGGTKSSGGGTARGR